MTNLSPLSLVFDDLMRHYDQYTNYESSGEFLEFVVNQEECRKKWNNSEEECKRLQSQLQTSSDEISRLERKIVEIRKHLEGKMELINKTELEKARVLDRNNSAKVLLKSYIIDGRMSNDIRERFATVLGILETGERASMSSMKSPAHGLDTISEANSTTDLSMTQSEDDLDLSVARNRRRSKRPSVPQQAVPAKRTRQTSNKQTMEMTSMDQLIAKTIVSFPKDGTVQAVASLETYPSKTTVHEHIQPSAPPMPTSESESDTGGWLGLEKGKSSPAMLIENQQRFSHQIPASSSTQSPRFGRTLSTGGAMATRPHAFCQKTVIKPEMCEPCGKRIKFSKMALKCRDCKATCHPECKEKVPIPCVSTGTPSNKQNQMGTIADYVPAHHPMVPSLIQHCVNEVEIRGLDTVGLYRVPGPEKEVKDLKEKFLRGKGVPNLARYDIHAICGCIKDFLRSLQEPLVGRWMWRDFAVAAELSDAKKRQAEMRRIVDEDLPAPNQDTLAFMLLHMQKVAECPEVKMPVGNLAKVFGPTIVGYSENDLDAATMLKETKKQQMVLDTLLTIPSDFWTKFVRRPQEEGTVYGSGGGSYTRSKGKTLHLKSPYTGHATPMSNKIEKVKNAGKKIYFSDDSPKEVMKTRSHKRTFFD
ncbi:unnamed protein product [Orchesella dallaii]|uniref:Rac GTPase-activating protein 1 n=1 Tax=Orchesella dallaii TaxID=48710 RepID=A0ABP1S9V4_9HEXA